MGTPTASQHSFFDSEKLTNVFLCSRSAVYSRQTARTTAEELRKRLGENPGSGERVNTTNKSPTALSRRSPSQSTIERSINSSPVTNTLHLPPHPSSLTPVLSPSSFKRKEKKPTAFSVHAHRRGQVRSEQAPDILKKKKKKKKKKGEGGREKKKSWRSRS